MAELNATTGTGDLQEDFEDFFDEALCGYVTANAQGRIIRANKKIAAWAGFTPGELTGKRFSDLLTIGGKIYYETHLGPLLRLQGFFDEVVLEISGSASKKLQVMVNALDCRDKSGKSSFIRYTVLKATDRLQYEQNLHAAKLTAERELVEQTAVVALREQLIAVLGHDLRNPLSALTLAVEMLSPSAVKGDDALLAIVKRSSYRMAELVNNIMDFARTRLGEGIILNNQPASLQPVLQQVVSELKLVYPEREIITIFDIDGLVNCDADRISQLLSNLIANALAHGATESPVYINASYKSGHLNISVTNKGIPIPASLQKNLFEPFTREDNRPSQNGLGLGLYISSEIARAHNSTLSFTSNVEETRFTFQCEL